jgi:hypothetical protein
MFSLQLHHEASDSFKASELMFPQQVRLTTGCPVQAAFSDRAWTRSRQMMKRPEATMMRMPIHLEKLGKSPKSA